MKVKKVCSACGSERIVRDAWVEWDEENQSWWNDVNNIFDYMFCLDCEEETYPHIVDSYDDDKTLDLSKVHVLSVDGIDYHDYPDFCDAYIDEALYDGEEMTGEQYDILHEHHSEFVYQKVLEFALEH